MKNRCLGCYEEIEILEGRYHSSCALKIFGVRWSPRLKAGLPDFTEMAQAMAGKMSISGVQPKISVTLDRTTKSLLVAPTGGDFILKPQNNTFAHLPENEDLCMHLATLYGISVPPHGLISGNDKSFAYVVKRFDRLKDSTKLAMEDFAQVLNVPGASKYSLSHEKIAEGIHKHCTNKFLDLTRYFERLLFCFAIGNGDMHLKNFSLLRTADNEISLSPAYDLLSSKLVIPLEEDFALTLGGKKNRLKRKDFVDFATHVGLPLKTINLLIERLVTLKDRFQEWNERSFLPKDAKKKFSEILEERMKRLR